MPYHLLIHNKNYLDALGTNPSGGVSADIYNMSFGAGYPDDDEGNQLSKYDLPEFISPTLEDAYVNGVTNLRNGKGALYVWSAGNEYNVESVGVMTMMKTMIMMTSRTMIIVMMKMMVMMTMMMAAAVVR